MVSISSGSFGYLKDNRALQLSSCLIDTLNDLLVVYSAEMIKEEMIQEKAINFIEENAQEISE